MLLHLLSMNDTAIDGYDKGSKKKQAINFLNFGAFALARFATVAELKAALDNEIQVGRQ